ncbi:uncharacterized protein JCM15063_004051 [Sporobolomyces koalae]|uniref:uncharacterized protein n=1 Tax=Sporobolomyces koalae TaxID=500713 RepID=UPI003176AE9B
MSSALRTASLLARVARPSVPQACARSVRGVRPASSHAHAESTEHFPQEGFNAPFWRKLSLAAIGLALYLRVGPSTSDDSEPWLTRYIAHNLAPSADKFKERNEKHLEAAKLAADDKLLFQEAEKPRVKRLRYLGTFDQASPNGIPVGSQADLSGLVIKSEKQDFAEGA